MKKTIQITVAFSVMLFCIKAIGAEITGYDLKGFNSKQSILSLKDVKLPKPKPPKDGGIATGAVFILGRYLPPPYEVTTDGIHVLINGVPCTHFDKLKKKTETEEKRQYLEKHFARTILRDRLTDVYQRAKWTQGDIIAELELERAIERITDYQILGIDKKEEGERGHKEIIVSAIHPKTGKVDVEVEGVMAEKRWLEEEIKVSLLEKTFDLMDKHLNEDEIIEAELNEYAKTLPWVKTFKVISYHPFTWKVNGLERGFRGFPVPPGPGPSREELEEMKIQEAKGLVSKIKKSLENDGVLFFTKGSRVATKNSPTLLDSIREIMKKPGTLSEKNNKLISLFRKNNMSLVSAKRAAEYITVFWEELGD